MGRVSDSLSAGKNEIPAGKKRIIRGKRAVGGGRRSVCQKTSILDGMGISYFRWRWATSS